MGTEKWKSGCLALRTCTDGPRLLCPYGSKGDGRGKGLLLPEDKNVQNRPLTGLPGWRNAAQQMRKEEKEIEGRPEQRTHPQHFYASDTFFRAVFAFSINATPPAAQGLVRAAGGGGDAEPWLRNGVSVVNILYFTKAGEGSDRRDEGAARGASDASEAEAAPEKRVRRPGRDFCRRQVAPGSGA